jgi:hypothetical protein
MGGKEIGEKVKVGEKSGAGGKIKGEGGKGMLGKNAGQIRRLPHIAAAAGQCSRERFPAGCKAPGCGDFQLAWR